ncbi:Uncharacterized protein PCOAH_00031530 [Plasmodium coatneyi]|uniref:Uncharacterized protein n=1 Tax=Plasmodium coatneyi TaxID=208452 RepID=A0A1B1E0Y6_9APIC|nr:Uncharacterized protein PCOAH_00031530 [Plasmodium coatneyi]ANQ08688.1 Uncharacterized protein PCOAH_00031530 [Plasmodium coatneyi]
MGHKIDIFLYICKTENEAKVKKDVVKRLIPTKRKFTKGVVVKYVLHNCKTKNNLVKKKWNISYILNKTKDKRKGGKKGEKLERRQLDEATLQRGEVTQEERSENSSQSGSHQYVSRKSCCAKNSGTYKKLLNRILRNVRNGQNTTIINAGVDTKKREKNVFFYGHLYRRYLRGNKKHRRCDAALVRRKKKLKRLPFVDSGNVLEKEETPSGVTNEKEEVTSSEGEIKKTMKEKESHKGCRDTCYTKRRRKDYIESANVEECLKKKKGLILDIYDWIVSTNSEEDMKISISSWVYRNSKIIDMLKKSFSEDKNRTSGRKGCGKTPPFCHRCFIKKSFDNPNFGNPQCCKELPIKRPIQNGEHLTICLKRIIKKCRKVFTRSKKGITNVCFVFKYKIRMDGRDSCVYLVNFPLCNIQRGNIFHNINNEKALLFLFNKKILKSVRGVSDYSNFVFPFNNAKGCQRAFKLKKKMLHFVSHRKGVRCVKRADIPLGSIQGESTTEVCHQRGSTTTTTTTPVNGAPKEDDPPEKTSTKEKTDSTGVITPFKKLKKKDMIFHLHLFELLIRLIFENTKTYFTFFITELTHHGEFYKNVYYLNLSKIVNVRIKRRGNKSTAQGRDTTSELHNLMKQNDECKHMISERDNTIQMLQNEVREKKNAVSELEDQLSKYKNNHLDKLKVIENLKSKISKRENTNQKENNANEQMVKNANYIKKLYNENNLLKEKIKKLSESIRKDEASSSHSIGKFADSKESSMTSLLANNQSTKDEEKNEKLNFFLKAFLDTEQKLYTADVLINTQKEIIAKIKNEKNSYFEEVERKKVLFKREVEKSLDFIHSICEDIKTNKEKICLANRINKLHDCINSFLGTFEKGP